MENVVKLFSKTCSHLGCSNPANRVISLTYEMTDFVVDKKYLCAEHYPKPCELTDVARAEAAEMEKYLSNFVS